MTQWSPLLLRVFPSGQTHLLLDTSGTNVSLQWQVPLQPHSANKTFSHKFLGLLVSHFPPNTEMDGPPVIYQNHRLNFVAMKVISDFSYSFKSGLSQGVFEQHYTQSFAE